MCVNAKMDNMGIVKVGHGGREDMDMWWMKEVGY